MPSFHDGARDYCRWLTRASRSHFALGLRLLPSQKRQAMEAVYAFCRAVDDLVDREAPSLNGSREKELERWRRELSQLAQGFPTHPILVALQPVQRQYQIPLEYFEELIRGVEMDLAPRRYATFAELTTYCERVASVVGLISVKVFGCKHPAAQRYARSLGIALQLTNILRDLKTDVQQNRLYLPLEELKRFGCTEEEIRAQRQTDSFRRLMAFECERAKQFFKEAQAALKESGEARRLLPAQIMGGIYAQLLREIEASGFDVFSRRISVGLIRQWGIAVKALGGGQVISFS